MATSICPFTVLLNSHYIHVSKKIIFAGHKCKFIAHSMYLSNLIQEEIFRCFVQLRAPLFWLGPLSKLSVVVMHTGYRRLPPVV